MFLRHTKRWKDGKQHLYGSIEEDRPADVVKTFRPNSSNHGYQDWIARPH
jgi:hypothetical protein